MLPQDPVILLSYVNTRLRDRDADLDALCEREGVCRRDLCDTLTQLGYEYNPEQNRFV